MARFEKLPRSPIGTPCSNDRRVRSRLHTDMQKPPTHDRELLRRMRVTTLVLLFMTLEDAAEQRSATCIPPWGLP
jgi:hypothetical protein